MTTLRATAAWIVLMVALAAAPAHAAGFAQVGAYTYTWEGMFTGARLTAMGGAPIASDTGPGALLVNPAPLPRDPGLDLGYDRVNYIMGADLHTYAGGVSWRGWRLDVCENQFVIKDDTFRTAYDPAAIGELEIRDRMTLVGLSRELGSLLWPGRGDFAWTVGAVYRRYSRSLVDDSAVTWDLGTSAAWQRVEGHGRMAAKGTAAWQNAFAQGMTVGTREAILPRHVRLGVSVEMAALRDRPHGDLLGATLAYAHTMDLTDFQGDSNHAGIELAILGLAAVRWGYSTRILDGRFSWGAGLNAEHPFDWPVSLAVDWGELDFDPEIGAEKIGMWSARGRVDF